MLKPIVGVLTWREGFKFREPLFFKHLFKESQELGITLYFFSPADVQLTKKRIRGVYITPEGTWATKWFPWPDVVIDRFWFMNDPIFKEYLSFRSEAHFPYANSRMANKWTVHHVLCKNSKMHRWLPETNIYSNQQLSLMLEKHHVVYVKPINGTGGRGIIKVTQDEHGYHVLGRTGKRKIFKEWSTSISEIQTILRKNMTNKRYVIQQGLFLDLVKARSVDLRILIQKDGTGHWNITGMGIRIGSPNSATSNLHGGGKPLLPELFLENCFPLEKVGVILQDCRKLAFTTAKAIEGHFGQMMEFGLDVGIDTSGRSWLIEVNPKPGRNIFRQMGQFRTYKASVQNPLKYALYLIKSSN